MEASSLETGPERPIAIPFNRRLSVAELAIRQAADLAAQEGDFVMERTRPLAASRTPSPAATIPAAPSSTE